MSEVLDRYTDKAGVTTSLVKRGDAFDIVIDNRCVLSSDVRRAEKELVELALAPLVGRDDITMVLAGLGMGFTLRALLDQPTVKRVDVIECSPAIVSWDAHHFAALNGSAQKDPRVHIHATEVSAFLKQRRIAVAAPGLEEGWLGFLLDLDRAPNDLWLPENRQFYDDAGVELMESALRSGGAFTVRCTGREPELLQSLRSRLQNVVEIVLPVELDNKVALDYVYRGRRPAPTPAVGKTPSN